MVSKCKKCKLDLKTIDYKLSIDEDGDLAAEINMVCEKCEKAYEVTEFYSLDEPFSIHVEEKDNKGEL